ncbi:hypothetical protein A3850_014180 [Lewinella sp. 4G2]|nr:hypothetical protein A3850_014180 [Lewinella sp. 4G2]
MQLKQFVLCLVAVGGMLIPSQAEARINPPLADKPATTQSARPDIDFRNNCDNAIRQTDMEINNVRARLTTGGDVWWDGRNGRYVVPKPPPGEDEVSSLFAGAVWLGGTDPGGGLKVAAQSYGRNNGAFDYYPGPLTDEGTTSRDTCARWDRFFTVSGENIRNFRADFEEALSLGSDLDPGQVPEDILGWPATGNPFFFEVNGFELPTTNQGLAGFWDEDLDGVYDPTQGDYPIIEIRGCNETPQFPEEMTFWIYNDAGNIHRESNTTNLIRMEIQVQAFAYATSDDINNMTFQRYKLINRAEEDILDTYFAMWVDPDLGCASDDFVGTDTLRSMAYVYNEDELDGADGCVCDGGVATYCDEIPLLGIDYFRGPRAPIFDDDGNPIGEVELGQSSFIYINNGGIGNPPPATTDPNNAQEYYNYLQGRWLDGTPLCNSGNGYDQTPCEVTRNIFPDAPDNPDGFSMVTADLPFGDRRTIQASGPFTLQPGAVNELIIGAVWVGNQSYPNPSIRRLQTADDLAQSLFDNCFDLCDGPDAPDVDVLELDREVVLLLSNDRRSNNFKESYTEEGLGIPEFILDENNVLRRADSLYRFEGYRVFQFAGPSVSLADIDDPDRVREIARFDLDNGVTDIFNWRAIDDNDNPFDVPFLSPELQVAGGDNGIRHSLSIKNDAFASGGETGLVNYSRYYFTVIAYGYNNYKEYDPLDPDQPGQPQQYKASSRNVGDELTGLPYYTVTPRPILDQNVMSEFGDLVPITRLAGKGNNGNFLNLTQETEDEIETAIQQAAEFTGETIDELDYTPGAGPIDVAIVNPLRVRNGEYEIKFFDDTPTGRTLQRSARWMLRCLDGCNTETIIGERTIAESNEQLIAEFGFSVDIADVLEPGAEPGAGDENGAIGGSISYADPDGERWLSFVPDGFDPMSNISILDNGLFNYVNTEPQSQFELLDPEQELSNVFQGIYPFRLMGFEERIGGDPFITPMWITPPPAGAAFLDRLSLEDLNNVDIVLTSDKSMWSRCPVIETANYFYDGTVVNGELVYPGTRGNFDTKPNASVSREAGADGLPAVDENADIENGMGWFPGYAIDVETGTRLEVFWGENSLYDGQQLGENPELGFAPDNGDDMIWNPSDDIFIPFAATEGRFSLYNFPAGAQHFFYVTDQEYDGGDRLEGRLKPRNSLGDKARVLRNVTWAGFPLLSPGAELLSYADGIIPNDVRIKLRVNSEFDKAEGVLGEDDDYPTYQFTIDNAASTELNEEEVSQALDMINVVPNPYYGFSNYDDGVNQTDIKITNLPARATITIYSLDGKFIRKYERDEAPADLRGDARPFGERQVSPALAWDLNNYRGIPVASGVYLIHVEAPGLGERTLKFFGIQREFDPAGF